MKITTKINLYTTAWLLAILLLINGVVFFSFMKITVNMEEQAVHQKAHSIIQVLNKKPGHVYSDEILTSYLTNHSFIRIIDAKSKVINQVRNDKHLNKFKPHFSKKTESNLHIIHEEQGEEQILIVRVPITSQGKVTGTIEIGERLLGLEMRKDILLSILTFCTVIAVLLSLLGGRWLSNVIMKPISSMIKTMENIEQSGVPQQLVINTEKKDELQKMAITFNRMIVRLQENLEKQKQFISDASHELRTPLTVIKSYANFLRRSDVKDHRLSKEEAAETIYSEATRMQNMTQSFLALATSEIEKNVHLKPIDLGAACYQVLEQMKEVYQRDITFQHDQQPLFILADEAAVKQVLIIVLDNAIKYSKSTIELKMKKKDNYALLTIQDYGTGIPFSDLEHIFERFYRADKARSRETGGAGLGLSIAKNIMKHHNGNISIHSEEGKGTEVELKFPI